MILKVQIKKCIEEKYAGIFSSRPQISCRFIHKYQSAVEALEDGPCAVSRQEAPRTPPQLSSWGHQFMARIFPRAEKHLSFSFCVETCIHFPSRGERDGGAGWLTLRP